MTKRKRNTALIAAGLLGVGVVGTLIDKANLFGHNPTGQWWWERVFAPPTTAMTVRQLVAQRKARARANRLRKQRNARANQLIYPGAGAGAPLTRGDVDRTVSKYVIT